MDRLTVETDSEAVIVVNERTGTIVMGKDVQIAPVAIMQGNLNVEIQTVPKPSPSLIR
jgi:flagellar P-ring protein precursor FlgI